MTAAPAKKPVRCAVYTRKSTEEGLEQEFNSLDAQRAAAEAFITSQRNEGWSCLPARYDDGGFTGGNMDRPALARLMADIEAGRVDCVVVYKVDRLSRSLLDFARMMEVFERRGVSFVSVTQQFNTAHSMGRLTLNVLLSFAQFERELISERTRDKIAAARRRGKYALGKPLLGYDYLPGPPPSTQRRLTVSPVEAERVRNIFSWYLEERSLLRVAERCDAAGWSTKSWVTTTGRRVGGRPIDKATVSKILRNPIYAGKVPYRAELHDGEHEAIVDPDVFHRVQQQLKLAAGHGGAAVRTASGALLKGLVRCRACGCGMTPTCASKVRASGGRVVYRYYVCTNATKRGRDRCPAPALPGAEVEAFVLAQVRSLLTADDAVRAVAERAAAIISASGAAPADHDELVGAAETFDGAWGALSAAERAELIRELVASVEHDAAAGTITVTFNPGVAGADAPGLGDAA